MPITAAKKTKGLSRHLLIDPKLPLRMADHHRIAGSPIICRNRADPPRKAGLNFWRFAPAADPIGCAAPSAARAEPAPSVHQEILRLLVHREGDDLAQVRRVRQ